MFAFPVLKECPCCLVVNIIKIGDKYENIYKSLLGWTLKKKFICRNCGEQIGFFTKNRNSYKQKKVVWIKDLECDEVFYTKLNKLQKRKNKFNKTVNDKYHKIIHEISEIQNEIRKSKIKLKIKFKIQKRLTLHDQYN